MGSSQDSSKTEVALATWSFWPNVPTPGKDFARLIPVSSSAKNAFRAVVASSDPDNQHKGEFMHWELGMEDSEQGPASSSMSESSSNSPGTTTSATHASVVTGFYRYQRPDSGVESSRWLAGKGRKNQRVHFILTTAESDGLRGVHLTFRRASSGFVQVIANHDVVVDGHLLRKGATRALFETLSIGHLYYRIEYLPQQANPSGATQSLNSYGTLIVADYFVTPTASTAQNLEIGEYKLSFPIGSGASSVVYYGVHKLTGHHVAVKRITTGSRPSLDELVRQEVRMLQLFSHANICSLVQQLNGGGPSVRDKYLILEPACKTTLDSYISNDWTLNNHDTAKVQRERLVRETVQQMSAAAAYMHQRGVMHRDIKLQNIGIVNTSGDKLRLVLLDFGHATQQTRSRDHLKGTVRYLAPEVLALKSDSTLPSYTFSIDVWALGVVALELIVGQRVRDPPNQPDVESLKRELIDDGSDTTLYPLLRKMLEKDEKRRPTMSDIEKEIQGKRPRDRECDDESGRKRPSGFSRTIEIPLLPHQLESIPGSAE